jgi:hypothetical protein
MNRPDLGARSFTPDHLHAALADAAGLVPPEYLPEIVAKAGRIRQRPAWTLAERWLSTDTAVRRPGVPRVLIVAAVLLLLGLLTAAAVYIGSQRAPERLPGLPVAPGAWGRVQIETPTGTGSVISLAASPVGLLAVLADAGPWPNTTRLAVSRDGRSWTVVPASQHPELIDPSSFGPPWRLTVVGTRRGFLLLQFTEVWFSENGFDWRRVADDTTAPGLFAGGTPVATAVGERLVAVAGHKAWYSVDGSDWSATAVPAPPQRILEQPESGLIVEITGVTAIGGNLVAWGSAGNGDLREALLWASHDVEPWASVVNPEMNSVSAVTAGPNGFLATGEAGADAAAWMSGDGRAWERLPGGPFASHVLNATAATSAGYVVVGDDGLCRDASCSDREIVIWTSGSAKSWTRLPSNDVLRGQAHTALVWRSTFVLGGAHDGKPAIWIAGAEASR